MTAVINSGYYYKINTIRNNNITLKGTTVLLCTGTLRKDHLMSRVIVFSCQVNQLDEDFFHRAKVCLSESEKVRFADCQNPARQQQFLAGHFLLRKALSSLAPQPEAFWLIQQKNGEPPQLASPVTIAGKNRQVYLSLSHTKESVVCAISLDVEVGIDIENSQKDRPFVEFSQQYLSQKECDKLAEKSGDSQKQHFYRLWTVMESIGKAIGTGLDKPIFNGEWLQGYGADNGFSCFSTKLGTAQLSLALKGNASSGIEFYELQADGRLIAQALEFDQSSFIVKERP